ncbi:MAG: C39 family peptidase [Patescibacteria group bacterium]
MKKRLSIGLVIFLVVLLVLIGLIFIKNSKDRTNQQENQKSNQLIEDQKEQLETEREKAPENRQEKNKKGKKIIADISKKIRPETPIPESINLDVPFTSQAPHADWRMPWQEGCEEAALIMVHRYLQGERGGEINKDLADQEILQMIDWQVKNWGGHYDLKAQEIAKLAKQYYGYKNVEVKYDIAAEDIKRELAQKNPVIVPAAGRLLENHYFTPPGPVYHNLGIVGYDANGFVANDPGVWQGYKFRYSSENLLDSIHDFVDGATKANPSPILNGRKAMIIMKK